VAKPSLPDSTPIYFAGVGNTEVTFEGMNTSEFFNEENYSQRSHRPVAEFGELLENKDQKEEWRGVRENRDRVGW
jgi:hypothetical protein